ncbi:hypothetical protein RX327_31665 [Bradyrhizobium sp. BEA-2-5]|uniref:hypothetical protein n=1 Tax=Bradyrhizobium sp. BEA-2-5 TaxID=3080015 RepID=UPI00293E9CDA|nr:hypothetical protein [Bradyrhizobium sp. BEA-2-5]WOH80329.1 hypothetical protein RX327_31665 [Bradyrhizobium sp. BEA-2-5]
MNNTVIRQRQAAIMDVVLGNTMTPEPGQLRLQVNLGTNMYLAQTEQPSVPDATQRPQSDARRLMHECCVSGAVGVKASAAPLS